MFHRYDKTAGSGEGGDVVTSVATTPLGTSNAFALSALGSTAEFRADPTPFGIAVIVESASALSGGYHSVVNTFVQL